MYIPERAPDQRGLSLIELIIFILVLGVGLAGILLVINVATQRSADPALRKQSLAVAEALLEEVALMPFTYCDPDDAQVSVARSAAECTDGTGGGNDEMRLPLGPEAGETRYGPTFFDNVSDYHGFDTDTAAVPGIRDITGQPIATLSGYRASVNVSQANLPGVSAALLIAVTVAAPGNTSVTLHAYRTRHAPRAP